MAKISELPAGQTLTGAELIPIVQNGQTVRVSLDELLAHSPAAPMGSGPDYWTILDGSATWDAANEWYDYDSGASGMAFNIEPNGSWHIGFRPDSVSLDLYIATEGLSTLRLLAYYYGESQILGDTVGEAATVGEWKTLTCNLSGMEGDLSSLRIDNAAWIGGLRVRNIVFS